MSTKIYNGYRLPPMMLVGLNDFIREVRGVMQLAANKCYLESIVREACKMIDVVHLKFEAGIEGCKSKANNANDEFLKHSAMHNAWCDTLVGKLNDSRWDSCVCLYPLDDKILAQFFAEEKVLFSTWEGFSQVHEYAYFNNMDRPKEISAEEWELRRTTWDKVFSSYYSIPTMNGLKAQLSLTSCVAYPDREVIAEQLDRLVPNIELRAELLAFEIFFSKRVQSKKSQHHRVMRELLDAQDAFKSVKDKHVAALKKRMREITIEDLYVKLEDL